LSQRALSAAAGGAVVEGKELEKKNAVLQQCREKIESVCFDLRLRKVSCSFMPAVDLLFTLQQCAPMRTAAHTALH
jgi:hypothetical protein